MSNIYPVFAFENSSTLHSPERNGRQSHASERVTRRGEEELEKLETRRCAQLWQRRPTQALDEGIRRRMEKSGERPAEEGEEERERGGARFWKRGRRSRTHTNSVQLRASELEVVNGVAAGRVQPVAILSARVLVSPILRSLETATVPWQPARKRGKKRDFKNGRDSISDGG